MRKRPPSTPRDARGRFVGGASGNPGGRPRGTRDKAPDLSLKVLIKKGGKTQLVDARTMVMKRLATKALTEDGTAAQRLLLREIRLTDRQRAKQNPPPALRQRSRFERLYYEEALIALGVLKLNRHGQLVIPPSVFEDLDRLYSVGVLAGQAWKAIQLAVESPQVLRLRFPGRRLTYATEGQARRAREAALDAAFADFDAMAFDARAVQRPRRGRRS